MHFLYFDPGTGALLVQFLVAAAASVVLFYKRFVVFFKSIFSKNNIEENLYDEIDVKEKDKENDTDH